VTNYEKPTLRCRYVHITTKKLASTLVSAPTLECLLSVSNYTDFGRLQLGQLPQSEKSVQGYRSLEISESVKFHHGRICLLGEFTYAVVVLIEKNLEVSS